MSYINGSYSLSIGEPPKDKNMKQALFFLASAAWILRLSVLALLSFLFLDSEDFAVYNTGKVAENFLITLSISWTKLSMFSSIPVVIKWRVSALNLWRHVSPVCSLPVVFVNKLFSCAVILFFNVSTRCVNLIASLLHLNIFLLSRGCSLHSSAKNLPPQAELSDSDDSK